MLRNFGRKELSDILDGDKKWHCYVCFPEPLVRLVLACDSTLQNLQNGGTRRPRLEPQKGKILEQKGHHHHSQDGQAFFLSSGLLQRTQRLIEMTVALNQSFVQFTQGCEEDSSDEEEDRTLKLRDYSNVPIDLQNAYDALQQAVETELRRSGQEDLRTLYPSSDQEHSASEVKEGQTSPGGAEKEQENRGDIQPMDEESRCSLWVQQTPPQSSTDTSMECSGIFELDKTSSSSPDLEATSVKQSTSRGQSSSPSYSSSSSSSSSTPTPPVKQPRPRGRPRKHPPKLPAPVEISSHSSSSETGGCVSESGCDSDFKDQQTTTKAVSPLNVRTFHVSPSEFRSDFPCLCHIMNQ